MIMIQDLPETICSSIITTSFRSYFFRPPPKLNKKNETGGVGGAKKNNFCLFKTKAKGSRQKRNGYFTVRLTVRGQPPPEKKKRKIIFFKVSNSARESIEKFGPKLFWPKLTRPKLSQTKRTRRLACLPSFCKLVSSDRSSYSDDVLVYIQLGSL